MFSKKPLKLYDYNISPFPVRRAGQLRRRRGAPEHPALAGRRQGRNGARLRGGTRDSVQDRGGGKSARRRRRRRAEGKAVTQQVK